MAVIYNPTHGQLEEELTLPLYYAGLKKSCRISVNGGKPEKITLDPLGNARVKVKVPGMSRTWILIQ